MPGMMTSASSQSPLMLPSSAPMHSYDEGFLRNALQAQIEFYFSPQNLANDTYLHSQMDAHRFVFISVIAEFKMVKKLTSDFKFIVDTIRRSHALELSDDCFKVRSNCKRSQRTTIILRNIASDIPIEEVSALFEHEQCAKVINLRSDIGNTWFVTFEGEEACLQTAHFLQKQMFRGKPLQLCVKSQNPVRTYYELPPTFPPLPMMPVVDTAYTQRPIDPHWPSPPLMPSFYTPPSAMLYPMPPVRRTPLNTNQGIISHTRPQAHYASPNPAAPSPTSSNPAAINNIPDTQLPPNAVPTPSSSNPPLWRGEDINIPPPPPLPLPPQHPLPPQQQQQQHQQQQHLPQHPPQQQHHPQHHHHQQQHLPPQHQQHHHHHHHHPNVFLNADGRTMVASALPTIPGAMPVPSFPDFNHVRQERRMHSQPRADYRPRRNNGGNNGVSGRAKNVNTRNGARKKNKNPGGARRNDNASDSMGETHADAVTRRDNIALGPENFPALPSSSNRSGGFHAPVVTATRERRASLVIRAATATASAAVNATTVVNTRSVGVNVVGEPPGQASNTHHTAASITESSTSTQQRGETSHLSNVSVASSTRHSVSTNTISVTPPEQHSRSNTLPKVTTPNNVNTSHHSNRNNHTSNGGAPSVAIAESSDEATPSLTSPDLSSSSSSSKPPLSYAEMARRTKAARVAAAAQLANVAVAVVTTVPRTTNESETRTQTSSPQVASTTSVNATANTTNISPPNK